MNILKQILYRLLLLPAGLIIAALACIFIISMGIMLGIGALISLSGLTVILVVLPLDKNWDKIVKYAKSKDDNEDT